MANESTRYRVVFTGDTAAGQDAEQVTARLAELLKLDTQKARRLISGRPRAVGKAFEREKAEKLRRRIEGTGAECFIEPVAVHAEEDQPVPPPRSQPLGPQAAREAPSAWSLEPLGQGLESSRETAARGDRGEEQPVPQAAGGGLSLALEERPGGDDAGREAEQSVTCPKCGHRQHGGDECEACGIIFRKYQASMGPAAEEDEAPGPQAGGRRAERHDSWRDLELFTGPNAHRYVEKFENFRGDQGERFALTWHWPALFVPFYWTLYRKLWLWAILAFISGALLPLISNVAWALTANYIYFRHARGATGRIRRQYRSGDADRKIAEEGGTSPGAVWLAIAVSILVTYLYVKATLSLVSQALTGFTDATMVQQGGESGLAPEMRDDPNARATAAELGIVGVGVRIWFLAEGHGRTPDEVSWDSISADLDLDREDIEDAWGTPIGYEGRSDGFNLRSAGADTLFDTDDDIVHRVDL
ncbi:MAG: DUF2628 domain-containing protein [Chromatiales bacterium]|jgi:hypothetical protein